MRLSFCLCLVFLAALPAAAQSTLGLKPGAYVHYEPIGLGRSYGTNGYNTDGYGSTSHHVLTAGIVREDGWDYGLRVGTFTDGAFRLDASDYGERYDVRSYLVGAVVGRTTPRTDRWATRLQGETWALLDTQRGIGSLGIGSVGARLDASTGYRVGYEGFSLTPTLGAYVQSEHRFGSSFVASGPGDTQPTLYGIPARTDLEIGLRAALPLLFRLGRVPITLVPSLEMGVGSAGFGSTGRAGLGVQVDF